MLDVDLTPRQTELADAALALVARGGIGQVSFRSVAAESGWSLGAVQKAFATKEDLLAAMFARLRASAAAGPATEPGRPTLSAWLLELFCTIMPLDEQRRALQLQGAAFSEQAAFDPGIGHAIAASDEETRGLLAMLVARAQREGEIDAHIDPESVAWSFLALAQGVATQLLYDPQPEADVRRRAHTAIDRLLGI